jgi:hypothetical protein
VRANESCGDVAVAVQIYEAEIVHRDEHDGRALRSDTEEFGSGYARNDERLAVNQDGFTDCGVARGEAPLPKAVGDCDGGRGAGRSSSGAMSGPDAQRAEIIAGYILTFSEFGLTLD